MTNYFCYYSKIECTGEILESHNFKDLYRAVLRSLRGELHRRTFYDFQSVTIDYGVYSECEGTDGYPVFSYTSIRPICMISGSGVDHVVHTYVDRM